MQRIFHRAGTTTLTDLLDAVTLFTQSSCGLIDACATYQIRIAEYQRKSRASKSFLLQTQYTARCPRVCGTLHFLCISAEVEIFAQGPAHNSNIIANFADTQIP